MLRRSRTAASPLIAALMVAPLVALLLIGFLLRAAGFARPYWLDESLHSVLTLEHPGFFELRAGLPELLQPILDFALRAWLWQPLLGVSEGSLRLPSLAFSLLSIVWVFFFTRRFLGRGLLGFTGAVMAAAWLTFHAQEIFYAAEARHYSFVAFASLLWVSALLSSSEPLRSPLFLGASALLLNLHFFALPLFAGIVLYEMARSLRLRRPRASAIDLASGLLVIGMTLLLNAPAFFELLSSSAVTRPGLSGDFLAPGLRDYLYFLGKYLALPVLGPANLGLLWSGWFLFLWWRTESDANRGRIGFLTFLIVPMFFVAIRARSEYPMYDRYLTPFLGLGFALMLLTLRTLHSRVLLVCILGAGALFIVARFKRAGPWDVPAALFRPTPVSELFEDLKAVRRPIIFLGSPCWTISVPRLYWEHFGMRVTTPAFHARDPDNTHCGVGGLTDGEFTRSIAEFLARSGPARVVLYEQNIQGDYAADGKICDRDGCYQVLPETAGDLSQLRARMRDAGYPRRQFGPPH